MRFWWVNHAQTMRQEVDGGYLWSPVTESGGKRSQFYDNMRLAEPGDLVLSFANGRVGKVGVVADFAISAPKPEEFGTTGAYWSATGWLLPVEWLDLPLAVRPKDVLSKLAPLLPEKYSPVQAKTGDGNQKAYLTEISRGIAAVIFEAANLPAVEAVLPASLTQADFATALDDLVASRIAEDSSLAPTEREQLMRARRGQGLFRKRVLGVEAVCRVTGIDKPSLLIASHIKPWRACSTASERLDGYNGLMLAPHADFLFDRGLLGFEDDGRLLLSSKLAADDARKLGFGISSPQPPKPIHLSSRSYFNHHRRAVYIP